MGVPSQESLQKLIIIDHNLRMLTDQCSLHTFLMQLKKNTCQKILLIQPRGDFNARMINYRVQKSVPEEKIPFIFSIGKYICNL